VTISHNPSTPPRPANRGPQGHGQTRVDLNLPKSKLPPAIRTKRKRA
jgi:hypothetical protein